MKKLSPIYWEPFDFEYSILIEQDRFKSCAHQDRMLFRENKTLVIKLSIGMRDNERISHI